MSANTNYVWGDRLSPRVDEPDGPHTIAGDDGATAMGLLKGLLFHAQEQQEFLDDIAADIAAMAATRAAYEDEAKAGSILMAHNTGAQAVSAALTTTYTGLCISNPIGSGVNLVMLGCNYALSVAPAGIASLHLIAGYSESTNVTHTTPITTPGIRSTKIGSGGASVAKADSAATTVSPTYLMAMGSGFTAGALYATTPNWIDLKGSIVVPPGGWIAWGALTAVTGFGAFMWKEVAAS